MAGLGFPLLCVLVSGFAGLVYQVTWQKYLSIYLGSHAQATALVLCVFFTSLCLGYQLIGKWAHLFRHKFLLYGLLEWLIGVWCLLSPRFFNLLENVFPIYAHNSLLDWAGQLGFSFLFLGPPTFLMGGTIPVLTQALSSHFNMSHKIHSWVYAINTVGAFAGTLAGGFYFLPTWGLELTLVLTSGLNILVGFACYFLFKRHPKLYEGLEPEPVQGEGAALPPPSEDQGLRLPLLSLAFLSGFYVFGFEVIIIRMAGLSIGSTAYTYSIVVASFVAAIALGSFAVAAMPARPKVSLIVFLQSLMFLGGVSIYTMIPHWPEWVQRIRFLVQPAHINFYPYWLIVFGALFLVLVVPVGLWGMNLPLLFHFLKNSKTHLARTVGHIYALNSLGCAAGALVGGYWMFSLLTQYQTDPQQAVVDSVFKLNLVCMVLAMPLVVQLYAGYSRRARLLHAWPVLALCLVWALPEWDPNHFTPGKFLRAYAPVKGISIKELNAQVQKNEKLLFYHSGPNTATSVTEDTNGARSIYVNGKPDSSTNGDHNTRALAPLLTLSVAPNTKEVFIAGLGAGLSVAVAHQFKSVEHITVGEIAQGVVKALPYFDKWNYDLTKEKNKKYSIHVQDAYKLLLGRENSFDAVIIEPSNPWVTGVEKLYSKEFYQAVRKALKDDGVFAQWFPTFSMSEHVLRTIFNNFVQEFPYVSVWFAGGSSALTILAHKKDLGLSVERLEERFNEAPEVFKKYSLPDAKAILRNQFVPNMSLKAMLVNFLDLHTLRRPVLSYEAGKDWFAGHSTPIDFVLQKHAKIPVDSQNPQDQYYYERLGLHKDKDFLEKSVRHYFGIRQQGLSTAARLRVYLALYDPKSPLVGARENDLKAYTYVSQLADEAPTFDKDMDFVQNLNYMVHVHKRLVHWRLPASLDRVKSIFGDLTSKCQSAYEDKEKQGKCLKLVEVLEKFSTHERDLAGERLGHTSASTR